MKPKSNRFIFSTPLKAALPVAVFASSLLSPSAHAQTWDGGGTDDSTLTANNWNPNTAPTGGTQVLTFAGSTRTSVVWNGVNSVSPVNFYGITFAAGASAFTINTGTQTHFQFTNPGNSSIILNSSSNLQTLKPDVHVFFNGTKTIDGGTSGLALDGGITFRADSLTSGQSNKLILTGTADSTTSNIRPLGAYASGTTNSLTKTGSGKWTVSGTVSYTGATTVSAGTLALAGTSSGTLGRIDVGGSGTTSLDIQAGSYVQGAGGFFVGSSGAGVVNQTGGAVSWNNNGLQLLIGNGGSAGTYNLSGGSLTTLTGSNTRGVMLGVNDNSNATFNLSGTGNLTVAGTSRLMIGRSDAASPGTTNLFSQTGGTATISDMTIGGPASGASGANSTLSLGGGTFTATAFSLLSNGINDVSTINIGGSAIVTLPNLPTLRGSGATATMNFDGGTLRNSATGTFITGLTNAYIEDGGATFDTSLNSTTISQNLLTHGSSLGGGLSKIGLNTLTLSGANTYTGGNTVSAGTLTMGSAGALGSTSGQLTVNTGGTLDMGSQNLTVGNLTGTGGVISGTTGSRTLTIGQGDTGGGNFQGAINNGAGGTTALTKTGSGTITLSGTNLYTGATNVDGGTLLINGSTSSTSIVTVASGATLGGSGGTVGGATTVNGTLASGSSVGTLNFSDSLALAATSTYLFELNNTTDVADLTNVTGTINIAGGATLNLEQLGAYAIGDKFTLFAYLAGSLTGTFSSLPDGTEFTDAGGVWKINYSDTSAGLNGGTGTSFVTISAIPEPSAALLGALGLLALLRRRRN